VNFAAASRPWRPIPPDIILVGRSRDRKRRKTAIRARVDGPPGLLDATTNDAPSSNRPAIDMGVKPYLVAISLQAPSPKPGAPHSAAPASAVRPAGAVKEMARPRRITTAPSCRAGLRRCGTAVTRAHRHPPRS